MINFYKSCNVKLWKAGFAEDGIVESQSDHNLPDPEAYGQKMHQTATERLNLDYL